jgi:methyl-accepting chemotaxis protein
MKLNISKKLGLGFGVSALIMILAGSFALYQLNKSVAAFRDVSENEMTAVFAAFGIRSNFDEMVWATKNILLRGQDKETFYKEVEIFNYKKDRLETTWQPMLEKILAGPDITDEQKKLYNDFKDGYTAFISAWDQALPIYRSRGREAADAILKGKGRGAGDHLIEMVRSMRAKALKDMEEATVRTRMAAIVVLVAFVIAVVIAVAVMFSVARELAIAIEGTAQSKRVKKG